MRATFTKGTRWRLVSLAPIPVGDLPTTHRDFLRHVIEEHFARRGPAGRPGRSQQYEHDIAILVNDEERSPPSNREALKRFERAARNNGFDVEFLGRDDYGRLAEFDALFIRETTAVNHYTYRFARRAAADGLVVIDDPESILKCTNKVYLAELLNRYNVPAPKTLMVHRGNVQRIVAQLALPCVLKAPDSAFSLGVSKVETEEELTARVQELLAKSELIVAQEWLPTEFDWRVGVLDRRPLYVCKYYMAPGHWQIIERRSGKEPAEGPWQALSVGEAPEEVIRTAVKAANLIGDGLYGVDLKQIGTRCVVIEVNDNPSIEVGVEDGVLKDALYREIMGTFLRRVEERKTRSSR
jgi:glutathione synthase/RimK-type ligase-like ATP-grasp enzyme